MKAEPIFLALQAKGEQPEQLQCLSNQTMAWAPEVWLFDLSLFTTYWRQKAQARGLSLARLWRQVLAWNFGNETHFQGDYRAACAGHPWRALLLLEAMKQAQHHGLALDSGQRGRSLLHKLSWPLWSSTARSLAEPWKQARRQRFDAPRFRRQIERFETAMLRLGIERPLGSGNLNQPAIAKRFGGEVALLWGWTLNPPRSLDHFPWQEACWPEPQAVRRVCDYPLTQWEPIAPLLVADLDRLQTKLAGRAELVRELSWELFFEEVDPITDQIGFRSPHDLREEAGRHPTLLTRMQKSLEQAVAQLMEHRSGLEVPPVTGWRLILSKTLVVPDQFLDLFGEVQTGQSETEQLCKLENLLPAPLLRCRCLSDWEPESSFGPWNPADGERPLLEPHAPSWPLFIFKQPQALEGEPEGYLEFLEERSAKWWDAAEGEGRRTYYKWIDAQRKAWWVFQDEREAWFVQGVYD